MKPRQRKIPLMSNLNSNQDNMIGHDLSPLHPPETLTVSHGRVSGYTGPTYSTSLGPPAPLKPLWMITTDHHQEDPPVTIAPAIMDPPEEAHQEDCPEAHLEDPQEDRPLEEVMDHLHRTIEDRTHPPLVHQDRQADCRYRKGSTQMYAPCAHSAPIHFISIASIS